MRFARYWLGVLPSLMVLLAALAGCGQEEEKGKRRPPGNEEEKPLVELKAESYGPISGKIVLEDGWDPPTAAPIAMGDHQASCHADVPPPDVPMTEEDWATNPQWIVGKNRGVKNVIVFLQPPDGQYFYVPTKEELAKLVKKDDVPDLRAPGVRMLFQPHCAFFPRAFVLFPSYCNAPDGTQVATNQKLLINSSPRVTHNYSIEGAGVRVNTGLSAGAAAGDVPLKLATIQPQLMTISCNVHAWMRAYAFVLDHPFAAVTNSKGEFEIPWAPLGKELRVVAWHEAAAPDRYFLPGRDDGEKVTLAANQTLTYKVKGR
jgi:hypothetical protein